MNGYSVTEKEDLACLLSFFNKKKGGENRHGFELKLGMNTTSAKSYSCSTGLEAECY